MAKPTPHTHCAQGHLLSPDNVYKNTQGTRRCVRCKKAYAKEYKRRNGLCRVPRAKPRGPDIFLGNATPDDFLGPLSRAAIHPMIDCVLASGARYRVYRTQWAA